MQQELEHLLVQANIWTEYIKSFRHVEYMAMPRMDALSEIQWNNPDPEERDFNSFVERCRRMAELYDLYQYNYAKQIFNPQVWTDTVVPNLATHKPITLREQPNEQYAYNGAPVLVDGEKGRCAYTSGRWLGFWGQPLDAVIDMEQTATLSQVRFNALVNKGAWIYNPSHATVLVSDDGKKFRKVGQQEIEISTWMDKDGVFTYELEFEPVTARYVELIIKCHDLPKDHDGYGRPAWIFVDEIEIN